MRKLHWFAFVALLCACSSAEPKTTGDVGAANDLGTDTGNSSGRDASGHVDEGAQPDIAAPDPAQPAYCEAASSDGFFPNCEACDDNGLDCDSIESPSASGRVCGCSGGCPCGLRCGSYEIGPNIVVSNICVR